MPKGKMQNLFHIILDDFARLTGLELTTSKSQVFLSKSSIAEDVIPFLGVEETSFPMRYLGLPLFAGMIKRDMCLPLLGKMRARLDLWKVTCSPWRDV